MDLGPLFKHSGKLLAAGGAAVAGAGVAADLPNNIVSGALPGGASVVAGAGMVVLGVGIDAIGGL